MGGTSLIMQTYEFFIYVCYSFKFWLLFVEAFFAFVLNVGQP